MVTATLDQLIEAHTRMLGRIDAAMVERRRAVRTGDMQAELRAGRALSRRWFAAARISAAMAGAR